MLTGISGSWTVRNACCTCATETLPSSGGTSLSVSGSKPNASASSPSIRAMLPPYTTVYAPPRAWVTVTKAPAGRVSGSPVGTIRASVSRRSGMTVRSMVELAPS